MKSYRYEFLKFESSPVNTFDTVLTQTGFVEFYLFCGTGGGSINRILRFESFAEFTSAVQMNAPYEWRLGNLVDWETTDRTQYKLSLDVGTVVFIILKYYDKPQQ